MGGLRQIKYNRIISKLNSYLDTLVKERYQDCVYYYDSEDNYILSSHAYASQIVVSRCLYFYIINEDILFDVIKKFTKYEYYSVEWEY